MAGGGSGPTLLEGSKVLAEVVIVTLPAVLLYFVGWVYLYFYLATFGIGVSELDLDIQTIFLFFMPPIRLTGGMIWRWTMSNWVWVIGTLMVLVIGAAVFWKYFPRFVARVHAALLAGFGYASRAYLHLRSAPVLVQSCGLFVLVVVIGIMIVPVIRLAARGAADLKWTSRGTAIVAVLKPNEAAKSKWVENYQACGDRRGLDLIFADKESYFMLCISRYDTAAGFVYEVRRDAGLMSVRMITRER